LILNEGRLAAQGTPEEIAGTLKGGDTWELVLKGAEVAEKCARFGSGMGQGLAAEPEVTEENGLFRVRFLLSGTNQIDGERIFDWAVAEGLKILGMNRRKLSLEDIFVKLTRDEVTDGETAGKTEANAEAAAEATEAHNENS